MCVPTGFVRASHRDQPHRHSNNPVIRNKAVPTPSLRGYSAERNGSTSDTEHARSANPRFNDSYAIQTMNQDKKCVSFKPMQPRADSADSKLDEVINTEMDTFFQELPSRVQLYTQTGDRFIPELYLEGHVSSLRTKVKRYTEEIASVNRITNEVDEMVANYIRKNTELLVRRAALLHKQTQANDVKFISPKRYKELETLKRKNRELQLLESPTPIQQIQCNMKDSELICMEFAEKLSDQTDPEIKQLAQKAYQYKYILGLRS